MYNLRIWEDLSLHLNVQAHLYSDDDVEIGTLTHFAHFYSETNLNLMLTGRRSPYGVIDYGIILCNNAIIARVYLKASDHGYLSINLDIGETVALSNINE